MHASSAFLHPIQRSLVLTGCGGNLLICLPAPMIQCLMMMHGACAPSALLFSLVILLCSTSLCLEPPIYQQFVVIMTKELL